MGIFEFDGEKYKKASRHQKEWGNSLIEGLELKGNESILDLGCGDGSLTENLALLVPDGRVLGIDASAGMIKTAEKCVRDNLQFVRMDINSIDFNNEFDVIFSNAALHWIIDHRMLLKNAFRALKPGGVIAWNFAGKGTCNSFFKIVREIMSEDKYQRYFTDFEWPWYMPSKSDYEKMVDLVGFTKISIIEENKDRYFSDADEMIRWIDEPSIVPFINCVPNELKEGFRQNVVEQMLRVALQKDGTCFETFRRIHFTAVK